MKKVKVELEVEVTNDMAEGITKDSLNKPQLKELLYVRKYKIVSVK